MMLQQRVVVRGCSVPHSVNGGSHGLIDKSSRARTDMCYLLQVAAISVTLRKLAVIFSCKSISPTAYQDL